MLRILPETNINFMGMRKAAYALSLVILLAGLASLVIRGGPRKGVDFAGGTLLDLHFSQKVSAEDLRSAAAAAGFPDAEIQTYEGSNDALFRIKEALVQKPGASDYATTGPAARLGQALSTRYPGITAEVLRQEIVGPKVGRELSGKAFMAVLFSVIAIMIYIVIRFHRWEYGVGAALALAHDIFATLGVFSILDIEIGLTVLAAFLTIAGLSINDTIVVFDRVRENQAKYRKMSLFDLLNLSINQTLSRTVLTVFTVTATTASLYFLGGLVIHDFALAILIGLAFGTYSSIFVASTIALDLDSWQQKRSAAGAARKVAEAKTATGARKAAKPAPVVSAR
ncbi:MAG: protein translocase subunit SecF [Candidatus Eisenbacteria bacterium]|nr:protein translocase subunit SecF [Candidatus Eisenbacteria bacterium]